MPAYCLALLQHLSEAEQKTLGDQVFKIRKMKEDDEVKARLLGLYLVNVVGESLLEKAVTSLGSKIKGPIPTDETTVG